MTTTTPRFDADSPSSIAEWIFSRAFEDADLKEEELKKSVFYHRTRAFVFSLARVLCYLRDQGEVPLSMDSFRSHLELTQVLKLANRVDLPEDVLEGLHNYLQTMPGMTQEIIDSEELPEECDSRCCRPLEMHHFVIRPLGRIEGFR